MIMPHSDYFVILLLSQKQQPTSLLTEELVNCPSSKADGLVTVQTYKRSENLRPFTPFL